MYQLNLGAIQILCKHVKIKGIFDMLVLLSGEGGENSQKDSYEYLNYFLGVLHVREGGGSKMLPFANKAGGLHI